jgi:hypothetical protein
MRMSSIQKHESGQTSSTEDFLLAFERRLLELPLEEAELTMKKLKFLGLNYDPFSQELSSECQQLMDNLELTTHLQNPYLATNVLLRLLDKTEERLNQFKQ